MRTTLIFRWVFLLILIGCNTQNRPTHCEEGHPLEHTRQNQTDAICESYDDCAKIVRERLLNKDYSGALEYMLKIENDYPDRAPETLISDLFMKCYINLILDKKQDVTKDLAHMASLAEQRTPSSELFSLYWSISVFEMRMKNYHKVIEYLDKIELPATELTSQKFGSFLCTIHITKATAFLMLNEHESDEKEYQMFWEVAKRHEYFFPADLWTDYIDIMDKATNHPDEYVLIISDQTLPAPMPSADKPEKINVEVWYYFELISKIDNAVVATYTVKM